jgi:hypothetical protein
MVVTRSNVRFSCILFIASLSNVIVNANPNSHKALAQQIRASLVKNVKHAKELTRRQSLFLQDVQTIKGFIFAGCEQCDCDICDIVSATGARLRRGLDHGLVEGNSAQAPQVFSSCCSHCTLFDA